MAVDNIMGAEAKANAAADLTSEQLTEDALVSSAIEAIAAIAPAPTPAINMSRTVHEAKTDRDVPLDAGNRLIQVLEVNMYLADDGTLHTNIDVASPATGARVEGQTVTGQRPILKFRSPGEKERTQGQAVLAIRKAIQDGGIVVIPDFGELQPSIRNADAPIPSSS